MRQETIERLLVRAARRGDRVVRLKAGDPFVFGRGGEEAIALAEAGVPHEVIPGISAALAAPALAGIPVTHRGLAAGFTVVSGHAEEAYRPLITAIRPGSSTLVVLMGIGTRARLSELLLQAGWDPATAPPWACRRKPMRSFWSLRKKLATSPSPSVASSSANSPPTLSVACSLNSWEGGVAAPPFVKPLRDEVRGIDKP